jgi:hypothetical protein
MVPPAVTVAMMPAASTVDLLNQRRGLYLRRHASNWSRHRRTRHQPQPKRARIAPNNGAFDRRMVAIAATPNSTIRLVRLHPAQLVCKGLKRGLFVIGTGARSLCCGSGAKRRHARREGGSRASLVVLGNENGHACGADVAIIACCRKWPIKRPQRSPENAGLRGTLRSMQAGLERPRPDPRRAWG